MEGLNQLLFELSSDERMAIMLELQRHPSNLTQIARSQDITVAEVSRHLRRLREEKLIQKDADRLYGLTSFGTLVLSQLSGLQVVSKHREYFLEYDASHIPSEFVERIGELAEGRLVAETLRTFEDLDRVIREAQDFTWILTDQVVGITSPIPMLVQKLKAPFDLRLITPEGAMPPDSKAPIPSTMPGVQKRVLQKADVLIVSTEKTGGFCLPNRSGRMDYRALSGRDPKFNKWCKDLFLYYWKRAKPFHG